jgi:subtilase family serine protease
MVRSFGSATYRQWLTQADLQANYLPTASDYSALTAWALSKGFQISSSSNNTVLGLIGTVAQIERAFFVNLITAQRPDGTIFYAPDRVPSLDLNVPVLGISGIDDFVPPRIAASGGTGPLTNTFQSSDFRGAYLGLPPSTCSTLTGTGQTVGIFANSAGFNASDVQNYITVTGLSGVPAVQVNVAGTPDGVTPVVLPETGGPAFRRNTCAGFGIGSSPFVRS